MLVSTRGRYALRVMVDLAEHSQTGYIPLKDISITQEENSCTRSAACKTLPMWQKLNKVIKIFSTAFLLKI